MNTQPAKSDHQHTRNDRNLHSRWLSAGFAATGLLIGLVAGLSETPVVGTLIPLLFTIIGGGSGFFVVKRPEQSRQVGVALVSLASMCILGSIWGIHLRQGVPIKCFVTICSSVSYEPTSAMRLPPDLPDRKRNAVELAGFAVLRSELEMMKLSKDERERIYKAAVADNQAFYSTTDILRGFLTIKSAAGSVGPEKP
jgi:hypothetical protein